MPASPPRKGKPTPKAPRLSEHRVTERDDKGQVRAIGVVALAPDSALSIVSAEPDRAAFLQNLVDRMNALGELHVVAAPPASAPEGAVYSNSVRRNEPEFRDALIDRLRRYYGLELTPA